MLFPRLFMLPLYKGIFLYLFLDLLYSALQSFYFGNQLSCSLLYLNFIIVVMCVS